MRIAVCWKWVAVAGEGGTDTGGGGDTGHGDARWAGVSDADEAALELALRFAELGDRSTTVEVFCLGPPAADDVLRRAVATGADRAVRLDGSPQLDGGVVGAALAAAIGAADLIICGDQSIDRGTGSTPAFIAAELGWAQALGLVDVTPDGARSLRAVRRLDGGRREVLDVTFPAVISVEGAVARLRRAPLTATLTARDRVVECVPGPAGRSADDEVHPYRPRPRRVVAPHGDALERVRQLLDIGGGDHHAELVSLEPAAAAARIVAQLREWGYQA